MATVGVDFCHSSSANSYVLHIFSPSTNKLTTCGAVQYLSRAGKAGTLATVWVERVCSTARALSTTRIARETPRGTITANLVTNPVLVGSQGAKVTRATSHSVAAITKACN